MPEPAVLRLSASDGQVLVTCGRTLLYRYDADDIGMRNLAIVALTDAGRRVDEVARGVRADRDVRLDPAGPGPPGRLGRAGAPPRPAAQAVPTGRSPGPGPGPDRGGPSRPSPTGCGVARSVISELLARVGPAPVQEALPEPEPDRWPSPRSSRARRCAEPDGAEPGWPSRAGGDDRGRPDGTEPRCRAGVVCRVGPDRHRFVPLPVCRGDAAAPLPGPVGAQAIFATLTGGPARRYDDLGVLTTATLGFALGIGTVEGAKHLRRAEAGAAVGLAMIPELATLRSRLGALADGSDPLALQRAFAARMLAADPAGRPGVLRRRPLRALRRRPPGRQGLEHQTPPRPARPGRHAAGRCPRPGRGLRLRRADRAVRHPARRAGPAPAGDRPGRAGPARASTGAGPTRPRSPPAATPARTGSPTGAPRWSRPPRPRRGPGPSATGNGSP